MGLSILPIHVWDRELDARILLAALLASNGEHVIIGHEFNISSLYKYARSVFWLHNGRPTNTYRSRDWMKPIKDNEGYTALVPDEGINDLNNEACMYDSVGVTEESLAVVDRFYAWTSQEKSSRLQNWPGSDKSQYENKICVNSNPRIELLGCIGRDYFQERTDSVKQLFGKYILISDNFGIEAFGLDAPLDETHRNLEIAGNSNIANQLYKKQAIDISLGLQSRDAFCNVINRMAKALPQVNFLLRPHPVSDHRYWNANIIPNRNITILYRDAIEPWIFSAKCIVHSGCTVGLQAEIAGTKAIDIGSVFGDHRNQQYAISRTLSSYQPASFDELIYIIRQEYFKSGNACKSSAIVTRNRGDGQAKDAGFTLEENLASLNQKTMNTLNTVHGLPLVSSTLTQLKDALFFRASSSTTITRDALDELSSRLGMHPPNQNKSRYYEFRDIEARFKAAIKTLAISSGIKLVKLKSPNVFLVYRGQ